MDDSHRVTVSNSVNDLEEDVSDQSVLPDVELTFGDHAEQIALAVFEDDKHDGLRRDDLEEGDDGRMGGGEGVKGEFPPHELFLPSVKGEVVETLDSEELSRSGEIFGEKDDTVGSFTKFLDEFESTVVDLGAQEVLTGGSGVGRGHFFGGCWRIGLRRGLEEGSGKYLERG